MTRVLIDTDVILDFLSDRAPFANSAAEIFSLCEANEIVGNVTPVIISNIYYILRKTATHVEVIEKLKMLITITEVLVINKAVVLQALNADFKDALQNYAAEAEKQVDVIITRNFKDYKSSALLVMTPDQYLNSRF